MLHSEFVERARALKGKRIEIPVHYDLWMRGARFGVVSGHRLGKPGHSGCILVKMDHPQVKRALRIWSIDLDYIKEI